MDVKTAASLLGYSRDTLYEAVTDGVQLPKSGETIKLQACDGKPLTFSEKNLQAFVDAFEAEQPGRHPPIAVRRALRTESRHRCAICRRDLPLQYHHIIEWRELNHHDPHHMLAICGGCHDKINQGQIDRKEQRIYKLKLKDELDALARHDKEGQLFPQGTVTPLSWDDLREVVEMIHETTVRDEPTSKSKFDFSLAELTEKNRLNRLGEDTFAIMREYDEPFFARIQRFLENPRNTRTTILYYEVVDELRRRVAATQYEVVRFEDILNQLYDVVAQQFGERLRGKRRTLRILTSFMYFNCDIGRKP